MDLLLVKRAVSLEPFVEPSDQKPGAVAGDSYDRACYKHAEGRRRSAGNGVPDDGEVTASVDKFDFTCK